MRIVRNRFLPFRRYAAMNLFGLLFCHHDTLVTPQLVNHERIHTAQMLEMGIIFFYLWYGIEWLIKLATPGRAYMRISFEREAYLYDDDPDYLRHRRPYAWWPLQWQDGKKSKQSSKKK